MDGIQKMAARYNVLVGFLNDAVMNNKYKDISGNKLCGILLDVLNDMDKEAKE